MKLQYKEVSAEEWQRLLKSTTLPSSEKEAKSQRYLPVDETEAFTESIVAKIVYRNPSYVLGSEKPCGVMLDRYGNPIPVYHDPNTGSCNRPYAKLGLEK